MERGRGIQTISFGTRSGVGKGRETKTLLFHVRGLSLTASEFSAQEPLQILKYCTGKNLSIRVGQVLKTIKYLQFLFRFCFSIHSGCLQYTTVSNKRSTLLSLRNLWTLGPSSKLSLLVSSLSGKWSGSKDSALRKSLFYDIGQLAYLLVMFHVQ